MNVIWMRVHQRTLAFNSSGRQHGSQPKIFYFLIIQWSQGCNLHYKPLLSIHEFTKLVWIVKYKVDGWRCYEHIVWSSFHSSEMCKIRSDVYKLKRHGVKFWVIYCWIEVGCRQKHMLHCLNTPDELHLKWTWMGTDSLTKNNLYLVCTIGDGLRRQ